MRIGQQKSRIGSGVVKQEDKERLARTAYELGFYHESHERDVFKASTTLAGGGASFGDSGCGAYCGGLLIIDLLKGRPIDNFIAEETDRFRSFEIGRALHKKFIARYGTVICRDVMTQVYGRPFWMVDPDEQRKMEEAGGHTTVCPKIVGNGAKWTIEVIFEENLLNELNELRRSIPHWYI